MKSISSPLVPILVVMLTLASTAAASCYDYGPDEYGSVCQGVSPDGSLAIATHGEGELGRQKFHVYLFDAVAGKKIGILQEIVEVMDTDPAAFVARWSDDSSQVTLVYRTGIHAPLRSMTYRLAEGRAIPLTKAPVEEKDSALARFWQNRDLDPAGAGPTFGAPLMRLQIHKKSFQEGIDAGAEILAFYKKLLARDPEVKVQFEQLIRKSPEFGDPHFGPDESRVIEWIPRTQQGGLAEGYSTDSHFLVVQNLSFTRPRQRDSDLAVVSEFQVTHVSRMHAVEGPAGPSAIDSDEVTVKFLGFRDVKLSPIESGKDRPANRESR